MPKLFISYRRSDTQMVAGRLRESLARHFDEQAIFRDKNSIAAGEDWIKAIEEALSEGVVVLALIGPTWATARDEGGQRRLDNPTDWNRVELESAFKHHNRVIPLLVDNAEMPAESELPKDLKPLARSNALKLRDDDWDSDIQKLVRALARGEPNGPQRFRLDSRFTWPVALVTVTALLGLWGYWYWPTSPTPPLPQACANEKLDANHPMITLWVQAADEQDLGKFGKLKSRLADTRFQTAADKPEYVHSSAKANEVRYCHAENIDDAKVLKCILDGMNWGTFTVPKQIACAEDGSERVNTIQVWLKPGG